MLSKSSGNTGNNGLKDKACHVLITGSLIIGRKAAFPDRSWGLMRLPGAPSWGPFNDLLVGLPEKENGISSLSSHFCLKNFKLFN